MLLEVAMGLLLRHLVVSVNWGSCFGVLTCGGGQVVMVLTTVGALLAPPSPH